MADYRTVNRANWDERAPAHAASAADGEWRLAEGGARVPLTYTLQAVKMGE
jgi:hypothetical protein